MKVNRNIVLLAVSLSLTVIQGHGQVTNDAYQLWKEEKYQESLTALLQLWRAPGGRTFLNEYLIGTSECRLSGLAENGSAMLQDSLRFRITPEEKQVVNAEIGACVLKASGAPVKLKRTEPVIPVQVTVQKRVAGVSGKGGLLPVGRYGVIKPDGNDPAPSSALVTTPKSEAELTGKRIPLASSYASMRHLAWESIPEDAYIGTGYDDGIFVIARSADNYEASQLAHCVSFFKERLVDEFGMSLPDAAVVIHGEPDLDSVQVEARRLHGVNLPVGTQAYSIFADLSITASGFRGGTCGTFGHELTHLMIRTSFGNAPPWLEEGLASEVAVAESPRMAVSGGFGAPVSDWIDVLPLRGTPKSRKAFRLKVSWREAILLQNVRDVPALVSLLQSNWQAFEASGPDDLRRSAITNALAASFVRFLDHEGKLAEVYSAIRDQSFRSDLSKGKSQEEILTAALGYPLNDIDQHFLVWLKQQPRVDLPDEQLTPQVGWRDLWSGRALSYDLQAAKASGSLLKTLAGSRSQAYVDALDCIDRSIDPYSKALNNVLQNKDATNVDSPAFRELLYRGWVLDSAVHQLEELASQFGQPGLVLRRPRFIEELRYPLETQGQDAPPREFEELQSIVSSSNSAELDAFRKDVASVEDAHRTLHDFAVLLQASRSTP